MIKDVERIQAARRVMARSKANVEFLQERIRKQQEPGFDRFATASGAAMRTYSQLDIDKEQAKIDKAKAVLAEYERKE